MTPTDFREPIIAESDRLLAPLLPPGGDPLAAGISYCVWQEPKDNGTRHRARLQILAISIIVLGFGSMLGSALIILPNSNDPFFIAGGVALFAFGFLWLFVGSIGEGVVTMRFLQKKLTHLWEAPEPPIPLRIENAITQHKLKMTAEDIGVIVPHPSAGCLQIEGYRCRYLIYAPDLILFNSADRFLTIGYRVAGETIQLSLRPDPYWSLTQQLRGSSSLNVANAIRQIFSDRIQELNGQTHNLAQDATSNLEPPATTG